MPSPGANQYVASPPREITSSSLEQQIGNYRLRRFIGRGCWGEVYLGEHCHSGTFRAIKMPLVPCSQQLRQHWMCTAQVLARLSHPHLVRLYDYGLHEGKPYLVMDYAYNGSLRDLAPSGTRLSPRRLLPLVTQLASALDYLHEQQIMHLALTPSQLLLGLQGQVLLSDIGLPSLLRSAEVLPTHAWEAMMTYAAPELIQGRPCSRSDQYALAIMVYEWLCGTGPFAGTNGALAAQHALCPPPSVCQKVTGLAPRVEEVLFQALARDPAQRYESVTAFARALEAACQQTAPSRTMARQPAHPSRDPAPRRTLAQRLFARRPRRS